MLWSLVKYVMDVVKSGGLLALFSKTTCTLKFNIFCSLMKIYTYMLLIVFHNYCNGLILYNPEAHVFIIIIFFLVICYFVSSALCYCTAELLSSGGRPLSVSPFVVRLSFVKPFSEPVKHINAKFVGMIGTFSPYLQTIFFSKFSICDFCDFFLLFSCLKMVCNSKTAGHRVKWSEMLDSWILVNIYGV